MNSARAALQFADCKHVKSSKEAWTCCTRIRAVVGALQQSSPGAENNTALFSECVKQLTQLLKSSISGTSEPALRALNECLQHCPQDVFLQAAADLSPELYSVIRRGDAPSTQAACVCYRVLSERMLQCLAVPAARTIAAQALAKTVAAVVHLLGEQQSAASQSQGFQLVVTLARCMPQVLRSQTVAVSSACMHAVSPPANTSSALPMETRMNAAHALACVGSCTSTSDEWAAHMHGLLRAAHLALALLPMPPRDSELQQAALDVLGGGVAQPWASFASPAADSGLEHIVPTTTLLLHCVACMLSEQAPMVAPLPMSALVLLASRLLSLRTASAMPPGSDPVQACQWAACTSALLNAGATPMHQSRCLRCQLLCLYHIDNGP